MLETLRATLDYNRRDIVMIILLAGLCVVLFLPLMERWQVMGDYTTHNQLSIEALNDTSELIQKTPHFLYHITVATTLQLTPAQTIETAGAWVMTASFAMIAILIYIILRQQVTLPSSPVVIGAMGVLALALTIMMPINFFTPENLYFGYFASRVYHNPTITFMTPFALVIFFFTQRLFLNQQSISPWMMIPLAMLTLLSAIAKPSFVIAYVPALGIFTAVLIAKRFADIPIIIRNPKLIWDALTTADDEQTEALPLVLRSSYIKWAVLLVGLVLPTFAILYYQTTTWENSSGIAIDPFRVIFEWTLHYEENADQNLLFKFVMSTAFPLVVYGLHIRKAYKNILLNTSWLLLGVSAIYYYFFVELGIIADGNFGWSIQIAVFILYITSTIFLLQQYRELLNGAGGARSQWAVLLVCVGIFALHIIAGGHWYNLHTTQYMEELIYIWW